jgi:DNA-binding MarR family transcriptional regulator
MVTKDSDITRLLDRLETQKLIERTRSEKDRRVVMAYITPEGLRVLEGLDDAVVDLHRRQLAHLGARRLAALSDALEAAREKVG